MVEGTKSIVAFALVTASTVSAGTILSPTEGQTLSARSTFNITFDGGRYFKESSNSVNVLLTPTHNWSGSSGSKAISLAENLQPTAESAATTQVFYADVTPRFFYESTPNQVAGDWTLIVVENYNAYGGGKATALWTQTVKFSE